MQVQHCRELMVIATFAQDYAGLIVAIAGLNGIITNDKFCLTRWGTLELTWWRRPLRLRDAAD